MKDSFKRLNTAIVLLTIALLLSVSFGIYYIYFRPIHLTGEEIVVGVVDSGCGDYQNERVIESVSFVNSTYNYQHTVNDPYDSLSHGRYVCSRILDVAPQSVLISVKIAGVGGEITYDGLLAAIDWLATVKKVDVINLSLGSLYFLTEEFKDKLRSYVEDGIYIVAASGNDGNGDDLSSGLLQWPAVLPWVLAVGALDSELAGATYSSFGGSIDMQDTIDFSADGSIGIAQGTSFAAPYISGVIARILRLGKERDLVLTMQEVYAIMLRSGTRYVEGYSSKSGWGQPSATHIEANFDAILQEVRGKIFITGSSLISDIPRFYNETFSLQWKVIHPSVDLQSQLTIESSQNVSWSIVRSANWGSLIRINVTVVSTKAPWFFRINAENTLQYNFDGGNNATAKLLMDNTLSTNGYNFPGAKLRVLDTFLRYRGYLTEYIHYGTKDLNKYDIVVLLDVGEYVITESNKNFSRSDPAKYDRYLKYLQDGGKLLIFGNSSNEQSTLNELINPLGARTTGLIKEGKEFVQTTNFTTSPTFSSIFTGVTEIRYKGSGLRVIGQNATELAWYRDTSSPGNIHALIVGGFYGNGSFIIHNSLNTYRNYNFNYKFFDGKDSQLLSNILLWLLFQ